MNSLSPLELPAATDDVAVGKQNLDRYGLTIHRNFIDPATLRALKDRLLEQAEQEREAGLATFAFDESDRQIVDDYRTPFVGTPVGTPRMQRLSGLINKGRVFIDLCKHPLALAYAQHAFGGLPFNVGVQSAIILGGGVPPQPIHTDQVQVPFPTPFPMSINVFVTLGDYSADMGATRFVPGSHRWPAPDLSRDPASVPTVAAEMEAGSALIWESRVWHGQGRSHSDKVRYSIGTNYMVYFMKTPDCHPALIHDDVYATLSDDERRLFGFDNLGIGHIGPRHTTDTRCNVGATVPYIPELRRPR